MTDEERRQLYDEACRSIFRGVLAGEFVGAGPHPHLVKHGSVERGTAGWGERGDWNLVQRRRGDRCATRYVKVLWLPAVAGKVWLATHRMGSPLWLPTDADPALGGFLFIDAAVDEVQQRLGWSQGRASAGLLDAFVSGEIATRRRGARSYRNGHEHFDREHWRGARLDVEAFRRQERGGAVVLGHEYHLHRFLVHATDFVTWLRSRTGGEAQEVVQRAPGKRDVPRMDHRTADALRPDSEAATTQAATSAATTIRSRTRWQKWLETQMQASPTQARSKGTMRKEGEAAGLPEVSDRGFEAAWGAAAIAAKAPRWRQGGRRPLSGAGAFVPGCGDF